MARSNLARQAMQVGSSEGRRRPRPGRARLVADGATLALTAAPAPIASAPSLPEPTETPAQRIEPALADLEAAVTLDHLRRACRMRTQTLCDALADLVRVGRVLKSEVGYRLA